MSILTKYRPAKFEDVIGHLAIIRSISSLMLSAPHAWLFSGPSGVGKTTLARIIGTELGAEVFEVDAGICTGVEAMRELLGNLRYKNMSGSKKCVILDEVHMISKSSWNALLKMLEEPPEHVYFVLCTTEIDKVPTTIKTRCNSYTLKDLKAAEIHVLLQKINKEEEYNLTDDILKEIAIEADGSVRLALNYLFICSKCVDVSQVYSLVADYKEEHDVKDICNLIMNKELTHRAIRSFVKSLTNFESARIQISCYLAKVALNTSDINKVNYLIYILNLLNTASITPQLGLSKMLCLLHSIRRKVE